jgi:hypothetical protein
MKKSAGLAPGCPDEGVWAYVKSADRFHLDRRMSSHRNLRLCAYFFSSTLLDSAALTTLFLGVAALATTGLGFQ